MAALYLCYAASAAPAPRVRVRSRVIGKQRFDGSAVAEAFEAGPIVIGDEPTEEGIAIGLAGKEPVGVAALWFAADSFGDAAVEAFDEAVGLRPVGLVRRCSILWLAQMTSNGCRPEGRSCGLAFISTAKRSVNSLPLSVRMV
ncbi:hypothetical protein RX331_09220 [Bradyrhizobium sp. BWA-3-5]|nr:hypothetical protein [Bradyrhizobium sp. BWA-3-5]WOH67882.1 hypothetical protein RX331_09220 [Bradyrhizobium sp. BWA-3-5]